MTGFNFTPEEKRVIADTTPEMWAEAAENCAKDPQFWRDLGKALVAGFFQGLQDGPDETRNQR